MKHLQFSLLLVLLLCCFSCKKEKELFIDLSTVKSNGNKIKIVLSSFRFLTSNGSWRWENVDSIITSKKNVKLEWPHKYGHRFLAKLNVYDTDGLCIAYSNEFVYSNDQLLIKQKANESVVNIPGRYKNAQILTTDGGEYKLYNNINYLSLPKGISNTQEILAKIKDQKALPEQYKQWREYESNVINKVAENNNSYTNLFKLMSLSNYLSNATIEKALYLMDNNLKKTDEWKFLNNYVQNTNQLFIGNALPTFVAESTSQKVITVNENTKGRYYFIDFWASWCKPCRMQMQDLKKIYNLLDTNKVQFISISIDERKDQWLTASAQENLKWPSYLQTDTGHGNLQTKFGLSYIPQNILVNSSCKIIAKNLSENEISSFLVKNNLFKK